jgi:glycosyltransferase involved in cell wall biosynthesis
VRAHWYARDARKIERLSVIAPMLNEAAHVEGFVDDLAAQDVGRPVEVLVADGDSTDGSVELLLAAAERAGVDVTVIPNPAGWVSQGLNACIAAATGDLLVRLDCHSRYPSNYLRLCVETAEETDAMIVGGIYVPQGRTPTERAVSCAMDSPFGGIGWMRETGEAVRRESDVVTYGAFRPEAFVLAGLFDESLLRDQDDEFTLRVRRAGGKVLLDSRIKVFYTPRGSYRGVFRQYFQYGYWKVRVMRKHRQVVSGRSLVPPLFVLSLLVLVPAAVVLPRARLILGLEVAAYLLGGIAFGYRSIRAREQPASLLPRVVAVYPMFHLAYGAGMLWGFLRTGANDRTALRRPA